MAQTAHAVPWPGEPADDRPALQLPAVFLREAEGKVVPFRRRRVAPGFLALRRTILLIDDDRDILSALQPALSSRGYDVETAESGVEALSWLEGRTPDLVILDVVMPGMSGFEVCRRIRADRRVRHVPVVFLSGRRDPLDQAEADQAGSDLYLTKPVPPSCLLAAVERFLSPEPPPRRPRAFIS